MKKLEWKINEIIDGALDSDALYDAHEDARRQMMERLCELLQIDADSDFAEDLEQAIEMRLGTPRRNILRGIWGVLQNHEKVAV